MLVRINEETAWTMSESRKACSRGYAAAGFAVECALKAFIMRKERLNIWPSRDARPELHTHTLRSLAEIAGISLSVSNPIGASWFTVLQWERGQDYDPKPMKRVQARSMVQAAFGPKGVVTWIRSTLA